MEGGTKWEAEEKREEEGGGGGEETYVPSLPTLRPPFNIFFPAQIFFALPPLSDRLEQATKDVFQSSR